MKPESPRLNIVSFGSSQRGEDHQDNEDTILLDDKLGLYAVADGVTLPYGGGLASRLTIKNLKSMFQDSLQDTVQQVNKTVLAEKRKNPQIGSSTLTAAHIEDSRLEIAHVGDSFGFIIRDGHIILNTNPDSRDGFLTNAIGEYFEGVKGYKETLETGDYLVLVTDGVTAVLNQREIAEMVTQRRDPQKIAESVLDEVGKRPRPYRDDRSIVVVKM